MSPPTDRRRPAARGTYFFLSYAHSAPPPGARADADVWVGQFFADLSDEVRRQARPVAGMRIGFFDQHIPLGADWKAALAEALGDAEVFVPLYSPGYFSRPWALGEQESFRARLAAAGSARLTAGHLTPVLWIPFPPWEDASGAGRRPGPGPGRPGDTPRTACGRSACWPPTGHSTSFC